MWICENVYVDNFFMLIYKDKTKNNPPVFLIKKTAAYRMGKAFLKVIPHFHILYY